MRTIEYELLAPFTLAAKDGGVEVTTLDLTEPSANHMRHTAALRQEFARAPVLVARFQQEAREAGIDLDEVATTKEAQDDKPPENSGISGPVRAVPGFNLELVTEKCLAIFTGGGCKIPGVGVIAKKHLMHISSRDMEQMIDRYLDEFFTDDDTAPADSTAIEPAGTKGQANG